MKYFLLDDIIKKQEEESFISSLFEGKNISVSIIYNSIYSNTKFLREFVYKITKNAQIDSKWRTRLVLIIDELNNNAIEYGSKQNDENLLQIEISTLDNIVDITISVKDAGT
jgi:anti-sigma regulatory factor (Ser/Thr protein kinase)